ncbi:mucin-2 [Rhipicephalus sanguineus]|uniref:mucin-2 n=1 Tax=Rhipicephalus sanguineus TaxID=34632 RepID=UPI001895CC97|nr:mucin-2 [Rhipicephalus sanguineus]
MKPVSLFLLAVCLLAVQAEDLAGRTFDFGQIHPALQHAHHGHGMSSQPQGHFNHVLPAHHGSHTGHAHGHAHQGQGQHVHQHQFVHGHQHNHRQSPALNPATVPGASNVSTVPVLMCRVVKVPVNTTLPTSPQKSESSSSGTHHVGSHIATSISHISQVFGRVVNPVVALLQNASVWLNRTAHGDDSAAAHHHQHQSADHHSLVLKKKLQVIGPISRQQKGHASVPTRPSLVTDAPTKPSPAPAVTTTVPKATSRSRLTTAPRFVPAAITTVGVAAPTLGGPVPRAGTFPVWANTITSTIVPASLPADVSSVTHVSTQVPDSTTASVERTLTSTRATLPTVTPTGVAVPATAAPTSLDFRANPFTATTTWTELPASIPADATSTTDVAFEKTQVFHGSTVVTSEGAEPAAFPDSTSTVLTTTLGSPDPRAGLFTVLVTSPEASTPGLPDHEQANITIAAPASTSALATASFEPRAETVITSTPEAPTLPVNADAPSVLFAQTTMAPGMDTTSAQASTVVQAVPLATRAPLAVATAADVTTGPVTLSTTPVPAAVLSTTPSPTSSQVASFTVLGVRSVRPKTR